MSAEPVPAGASSELAAVLASASAPLDAKDAEGRYLFVSDEWTRVYGICRDAAIGKTDFDLFDANEAEKRRAHDRDVVDAGKALRFDETVQMDDGPHALMSIRFPILDDSAETTTVCGITTDVTSRERARDRIAALKEELELRVAERTEQLRDSHALLHSIVHGTPDAVFVKDLEGRYLLVNEACAERLSSSVVDLVGRLDLDHFSGETHAAIRNHDDEVIATGRAITFEENITIAGRRRYELVTKSPYRDAGGAVAGVVGIAHDLTIRKAAEDALADGEERLRLALAGGRMGTWDHDVRTGTVVVSETLQQLGMGESFESFISAVHPDDRDRAERTIREAIESGTDIEVELRLCVRDGGTRWIVARGHVLRGPDGKPTRVVGVAIDVTDRKADEEALRRSRELYRRVVEGSTEPIALLDRGGNAIYVSPSFEASFGYSIDDLRGGDVFSIAGVADEREESWDQLARVLGGETVVRAPFAIRVPDGGVREVEISAAPVFDPDGDPDLIVCNFRDVTDARRAEKLEQELRQAQRLESVGRLAAGVAHDFNNILLAIRGYAELALPALSEEDGLRGDVEQIVLAADRAAALTHQLLAFSRRQVFNAEVLDLNGIVAEGESLLGRVIGEDVDLVVERSPDPVWIRADRGQLEQVLTNLVVNARDAMPAGGKLTLSVGTTRLGAEAAAEVGVAPGPYALLTVTDDGSGMDDETLSQLFEPFFTTKGDLGTGLGLSTALGIVVQSGGRIRVASAPGKGATFTIYLPLTLDPPAEAAPPAAPAGGRETILLVEDDLIIRSIVCSMLERHGYRVVCPANAEEAIATAAELDTLDLLVTDVVMPGLGGREVAERVTEAHPGVAVLYISGYADDAVVRDGALSGTKEFLQKPFGSDELAHRVRRALDATRVA